MIFGPLGSLFYPRTLTCHWDPVNSLQTVPLDPVHDPSKYFDPVMNDPLSVFALVVPQGVPEWGGGGAP